MRYLYSLSSSVNWGLLYSVIWWQILRIRWKLCSDRLSVWYPECWGPVLRSSILFPMLFVCGRIYYMYVLLTCCGLDFASVALVEWSWGKIMLIAGVTSCLLTVVSHSPSVCWTALWCWEHPLWWVWAWVPVVGSVCFVMETPLLS